MLAKHEQFEMDVLYHLNSGRILEKIVFGGGTMLRLCHELSRYSADLDFWLIKTVAIETFQNKITAHLADEYEITDNQIKHFSLVVEVRTPAYPRRLKIEIRKDIREWDLEKSIAFSKYSNRQVLLYTHTLSQTMDNKIAALITRGEIRDAFDIEFLLRKGITLPEMTMEDKSLLKKCLKSFRENDFKVKLGSILDEEMQSYYIKNHFRYLEEKL